MDKQDTRKPQPVTLHELRKQVLRAWLENNKKKIEVFCLPSYSPELNPEERLNTIRSPDQ